MENDKNDKNDRSLGKQHEQVKRKTKRITKIETPNKERKF